MTRRAIVLGSNGPASSGDLHYAKSDAEQVAAALRTPRCGFEVTLLDSVADPQTVEKSIAHVAESCTGEDTFAVFFSGHGFVDGGSLWLMLDQTDINKKLTTALHADAIVRNMKYCPAQHKVLILDCCHAGMVFSDSRFKDAGSKIETVVGQASTDSESFVAIVASDRLERTREFDEFKGSFLTTALCSALGEAFDEADKDKDGAIDLWDLKAWITSGARIHNMRNPSRTVPVPFVFGRERGRLFFTREPTDWLVHEVSIAEGFDFVVLPYLNWDDGVWMLGKTPVTNAQYRRFVEETGKPEPVGEQFVGGIHDGSWRGPFRPWEFDEFKDDGQPVVCVNFLDAQEFEIWAESSISECFAPCLVPLDVWDFAAFGTPYPSHSRQYWKNTPWHHNSASPAIVTGEHGRKNKYGAVDIFGNVWEWTNSDRFAKRQRARHARRGSIADWTGSYQDIRGGSFLEDLEKIDPILTSFQLKDGIMTKHSDLGFRLACQISLDSLPGGIVQKLAIASIREHHIRSRRQAVTA